MIVKKDSVFNADGEGEDEDEDEEKVFEVCADDEVDDSF
jgi:hypothetical protein